MDAGTQGVEKAASQEQPEKPKILKKTTSHWLNERGFPLLDHWLKRRAAHWPPHVWQAYLENLEVGRHEDLGRTKDRSLLLQEFADRDVDELDEVEIELLNPSKSVSDFISETSLGAESDPIEEVIPQDEEGELLVYERPERTETFDLHDEVQQALKVLNPNEYNVIWLMFWEGRSERQIGLIVRKSRWTVRTWKERAFEKLKPVLSPIYRKYGRTRSTKSYP